MTESLLEKFNKGVQGGIQLTQEEIKTLEAVGIEDLDDIDRVGFFEVLQDLGKSFLGYFVGKPAKTTEPMLENAVVVLSDFEKGLEHELENVETGKDAIAYAKRAILRSRLRKRVKDAAQFGANQIEYITKSTQTSIEPFLDDIELPLAGAGTAVGNYVASEATIAARSLIENIGESTIGALEVVKNIPSNISSYAKKTYENLPDFSSFSSWFWSLVDVSSDFFYIVCALILLGKFDFLLKNIYILFVVALILVYTLHTR